MCVMIIYENDDDDDGDDHDDDVDVFKHFSGDVQSSGGVPPSYSRDFSPTNCPGWRDGLKDLKVG